MQVNPHDSPRVVERGQVTSSPHPRHQRTTLALVHFGVGRKLADALIENGLVRSTSPFADKVPLKDVTWLDPRLSAEISYAEILPGGSLRVGVFRGFVGE